MEYQRVGGRGHLFTWEEPYLCSVYVVDAPGHVFMVDTFLGPDPMEDVQAKLREIGVGKPDVVFNTHADYDHIWGNMAFEGSLIVAHDSSLKRISAQGEEAMTRFKAHMMGAVRLRPPNLVFRKRIAFVEDGVEFFYTPGHTGDSASCFDSVDRVLIAGDNIVAPYPYINLLNLKEYIQSLEEYKRLGAKTIIPGHDPPQRDSALLDANLDYLRMVASGHVDLGAMDQRQLGAHYPNTVRLAELYTEKADKAKAKEYYGEALKVLNLLEPSTENEARKAKVSSRLKDLG
ncbi:MAG: MBL fold metallo-hydrolase [Candidatus Bathyarchaeia archaeon]